MGTIIAFSVLFCPWPGTKLLGVNFSLILSQRICAAMFELIALEERKPHDLLRVGVSRILQHPKTS